jgi:predicted secreted hydrolase
MAGGYARRAAECAPWSTTRSWTAAASTGAIYWEGLSDTHDAQAAVGQGYLEMTGYARALQL